MDWGITSAGYIVANPNRARVRVVVQLVIGLSIKMAPRVINNKVARSLLGMYRIDSKLRHRLNLGTYLGSGLKDTT